LVEQERLEDTLRALSARVDNRPVRSLEVKVLLLFLTLPARVLVRLNLLWKNTAFSPGARARLGRPRLEALA